MIQKNDLFDYENRYIYQDSDFFKFSVDSILLAEYIDVTNKEQKILDMCAGNMSVGLILSKYTKSKIVGFEIQNKIFELGKKSIELNKLDNQLSIINDDIKNINNYYKSDYFDIMFCNPPYFKTSNNILINEKNELAIARHELKLCMEDIFKIAKSYLKNNGCLYIVHRANRFDELIINANKYNINIKKACFISTKKGDKPYLVLVKCVKNSKYGIIIQKEKCIENLKTYKEIFKEEK